MKIDSFAIVLAVSVIRAAGECEGIFLADEMMGKEASTELLMGQPFGPR